MFQGCIKQGTFEDLYEHFAIFFYLVRPIMGRTFLSFLTHLDHKHILFVLGSNKFGPCNKHDKYA